MKLLTLPYTIETDIWSQDFMDDMITEVLTHRGLMTPYGGMDLGQHWLR